MRALNRGVVTVAIAVAVTAGSACSSGIPEDGLEAGPDETTDDTTTETSDEADDEGEDTAIADGEAQGDPPPDPTLRLEITRERLDLPATETRLGDQVVSEVGGSGGDASATTGSQVSASEATANERNLTELGAVRTPEGLVVTLPETVLFDFDEADVRPDAAATLDQVGEVVAFYDTATVEVQGHTDSRGDDAYNQDLSERRAEAVLSDLTGRPGVDAGRLSAQGFGETRPVAPNERHDGSDDPEGRQQNRRVEILLREV